MASSVMRRIPAFGTICQGNLAPILDFLKNGHAVIAAGNVFTARATQYEHTGLRNAANAFFLFHRSRWTASSNSSYEYHDALEADSHHETVGRATDILRAIGDGEAFRPGGGEAVRPEVAGLLGADEVVIRLPHGGIGCGGRVGTLPPGTPLPSQRFVTLFPSERHGQRPFRPSVMDTQMKIHVGVKPEGIW